MAADHPELLSVLKNKIIKTNSIIGAYERKCTELTKVKSTNVNLEQQCFRYETELLDALQVLQPTKKALAELEVKSAKLIEEKTSVEDQLKAAEVTTRQYAELLKEKEKKEHEIDEAQQVAKEAIVTKKDKQLLKIKDANKKLINESRKANSNYKRIAASHRKALKTLIKYTEQLEKYKHMSKVDIRTISHYKQVLESSTDFKDIENCSSNESETELDENAEQLEILLNTEDNVSKSNSMIDLSLKELEQTTQSMVEANFKDSKQACRDLEESHDEKICVPETVRSNYKDGNASSFKNKELEMVTSVSDSRETLENSLELSKTNMEVIQESLVIPVSNIVELASENLPVTDEIEIEPVIDDKLKVSVELKVTENQNETDKTLDIIENIEINQIQEIQQQEFNPGVREAETISEINCEIKANQHDQDVIVLNNNTSETISSEELMEITAEDVLIDDNVSKTIESFQNDKVIQGEEPEKAAPDINSSSNINSSVDPSSSQADSILSNVDPAIETIETSFLPSLKKPETALNQDSLEIVALESMETPIEDQDINVAPLDKNTVPKSSELLTEKSDSSLQSPKEKQTFTCQIKDLKKIRRISSRMTSIDLNRISLSPLPQSPPSSPVLVLQTRREQLDNLFGDEEESVPSKRPLLHQDSGGFDVRLESGNNPSGGSNPDAPSRENDQTDRLDVCEPGFNPPSRQDNNLNARNTEERQNMVARIRPPPNSKLEADFLHNSGTGQYSVNVKLPDTPYLSMRLRVEINTSTNELSLNYTPQSSNNPNRFHTDNASSFRRPQLSPELPEFTESLPEFMEPPPKFTEPPPECTQQSLSHVPNVEKRPSLQRIPKPNQIPLRTTFVPRKMPARLPEVCENVYNVNPLKRRISNVKPNEIGPFKNIEPIVVASTSSERSIPMLASNTERSLVAPVSKSLLEACKNRKRTQKEKIPEVSSSPVQPFSDESPFSPVNQMDRCLTPPPDIDVPIISQESLSPSNECFKKRKTTEMITSPKKLAMEETNPKIVQLIDKIIDLQIVPQSKIPSIFKTFHLMYELDDSDPARDASKAFIIKSNLSNKDICTDTDSLINNALNFLLHYKKDLLPHSDNDLTIFESTFLAFLFYLDDNKPHTKNLVNRFQELTHCVIVSEHHYPLNGLAIVCRIYAAICLQKGDADLVRLTGLNLISSRPKIALYLVANFISIWPNLFAPPLQLDSMDFMRQLILIFLSNEQNILKKSLQEYSMKLIEENCHLKDLLSVETILEMLQRSFKSDQTLQEIFEFNESFLLVCQIKGFKWTVTEFIPHLFNEIEQWALYSEHYISKTIKLIALSMRLCLLSQSSKPSQVLKSFPLVLKKQGKVFLKQMMVFSSEEKVPWVLRECSILSLFQLNFLSKEFQAQLNKILNSSQQQQSEELKEILCIRAAQN